MIETTSADRRAITVIAAVWLLTTLIWLRPGITRPDGVAYFSYLPSTYLDGDLLLFNEWQHFGMLRNGLIQSEGLTANGHLADHWTVGSAVVWYPAFVAGDVLRAFVPSLGAFPRDGISLPYNAAAVAASALCGLITLLTGYFIARRMFPTPAAVLAAISTWFGSSLLWYSTQEALMAHAISAAACAVVVLASMPLQKRLTAEHLFAAGIAAGLAFAIRPQNATFIAVPFLIAGAAALRRWMSVLLGFLVGALPQLVVTYFLYGNPLALFNVAPGNVDRPWHSFERLWLWEPLLSWYHGLATWTPLLALGIIGFPLLWRAHRGLGSAAIIMFLTQWAANATIDRFFWAGSSFGQRRFDNCTIFFLLGAAALFASLPRWLAILLASLTSVWTMGLFFAASSSIDLNRYYTPSELLHAAVEAPKKIGLLISVPPAMKPAVLITFVAVIAVYAALAAVIRMRPGWIAGIYCVGIAAFFAICGMNDAARMNDWNGVIARNRAIEPYSGAVHDRLALLRDEEIYLRRTGRTAEAEATRGEIRVLEKSIRY
jgi:hypothetical protein